MHIVSGTAVGDCMKIATSRRLKLGPFPPNELGRIDSLTWGQRKEKEVMSGFYQGFSFLVVYLEPCHLPY